MVSLAVVYSLPRPSALLYAVTGGHAIEVVLDHCQSLGERLLEFCEHALDARRVVDHSVSGYTLSLRYNSRRSASIPRLRSSQVLSSAIL